jgi:hypothetical protein
MKKLSIMSFEWALQSILSFCPRLKVEKSLMSILMSRSMPAFKDVAKFRSLLHKTRSEPTSGGCECKFRIRVGFKNQISSDRTFW